MVHVWKVGFRYLVGFYGEEEMREDKLIMPIIVYSSKLCDSNPGGWDSCLVIDSLILSWDQKLIASPHSQLVFPLIFFV